MKNSIILPFLCLVALIGVQADANAENEPVVKSLCTQLSEYQSGGADYVPGVDVEGNPVASADLEEQVPALYDPVIIPVTVDLAARYGLSLPQGVELKPEVAWLEIYRDGRVLYNGEDVRGRLHAACLLENPENPPEQDGQAGPDPLVSGNNKEKSTSGVSKP
ncbi:MAG: hypothetical protein KDI65_08525 [Alphaproteobacteria bacterium]|nr:hypothetical protein [Alphaproteobacteria bacterium]